MLLASAVRNQAVRSSATAGNFAIPLNPPETPTGPVCRFSVYHLMEVDSPTDMFPVRYMEI